MSVTINVTGLDPEDYYAKIGDAAVAATLAAKHGGVKTGGGTDFTTGKSDVDFTVPEAAAAGFEADLAAAGLTYRRFGSDE